MRFLLPILFCAVAQASLLNSDTPVTLDTAEMARVWQEVKSGKAASAAEAPADDAWQAALLQEDEEVARVLLLAWLQQQNPQCPMAQYASDYAAALVLHRLALAGVPKACRELAGAYRSGCMGALCLPVCEAKARWVEQRAIQPGLLPR